MEAYAKVMKARDAKRISNLQIINKIITDFTELHGDRRFADDGAIVGGIGYLKDMPVTVIAMERGSSVEERLKRNFNFLRKQKGKLSPWKMNIFRFLPLPFLTIMLAVTFGSSFGDKFMYQHAMKAPDEMRELHKQFYAYMKKLKEARYEIL